MTSLMLDILNIKHILL